MSESLIKKYHLHKDEPEKLQFEIYSLKEYLPGADCSTQKPHSHSFYQIIWFRSGHGKHYVDFKEYEVEGNTLFFVSSGQIHHFDENKYEGCIIHFNESFLGDPPDFINLFLRHTIFHSFEKEPFFIVQEKDDAELLHIVTRMQHEMETPHRFAHREYLKVLLHLFLIVIQRVGVRKDCQGLTMNNPSHILYVKFRQLLENNFDRIHTVSEYAVMLHVSTKTLYNCTREISQQTPLEVINERLILEAWRLLSYSGKNVNEIGFSLGFEDPSYFVKFFKRQVKSSPKQYRELTK